MVYGLEPDKFNCHRVFNLFCQYGNIVRIMFMKTKEGCAMVELADPDSCERAIANLNHTPIPKELMLSRTATPKEASVVNLAE